MPLRLFAGLAVCWLSGFVGLAQDKPKDAVLRRELAQFQGQWDVVAHVSRGELQKVDKMTLTFEGEKVIFQGDGRRVTGMIKLNPGKTPREIDLTFAEGPVKGETMPGIYQFAEGSLTLCFGRPGAARPGEFASTESTKTVLYTLKRAK
jgi:uncharacterized protein (TIGR03067 family)